MSHAGARKETPRTLQLSRTSAYWLVGYALFIVITAVNLATPLYPVYSKEWHFSSGIVTLIFATYALVLIPALLICGRISDYIGRRRVLLAGLLLAAGGSALFAAAQGVPWLFLGRALQGLSVALISGTATAALTELHPRGNREQAALLSSVASVGGAGAGPLLTGVPAQYGPWPQELSYLVSLLLLGLAVMAIWAMPESLATSPTDAWRIQRPAVPADIRLQFALGSVAAAVGWAVGALFLAVLPSYVGSLLGQHNLAIAGGTVFLMLAAAVATQLMLRKASPRMAMGLGSALLIGGLGGIVLAVPLSSLAIVLLSTVLAGGGLGLNFRGGIALVNEVAPDEKRADILSTAYAVNYVGLGVPVIGVGLGAERIGLYGAVSAFAAVIGVLCLAVLMAARLAKGGVAAKEERRQAA
jgi:hypothetical protein